MGSSIRNSNHPFKLSMTWLPRKVSRMFNFRLTLICGFGFNLCGGHPKFHYRNSQGRKFIISQGVIIAQDLVHL